MHLALDLVIIVVSPPESESSWGEEDLGGGGDWQLLTWAQITLQTKCRVVSGEPLQTGLHTSERTLDLHHGLRAHHSIRRGCQERFVGVDKQPARLHPASPGLCEELVELRQGLLLLLLPVPDSTSLIAPAHSPLLTNTWWSQCCPASQGRGWPWRCSCRRRWTSSSLPGRSCWRSVCSSSPGPSQSSCPAPWSSPPAPPPPPSPAWPQRSVPTRNINVFSHLSRAQSAPDSRENSSSDMSGSFHLSSRIYFLQRQEKLL